MSVAPINKRKVTLYVQSIKTLIGTEEWGRWGYVASPSVRPGGYRLVRDYKTYSEPKYERVLPEDQKKFVEIVKDIALKHGFDVEIVDVAKEKELKIKVFPTLITDSGEKIEGNMPQEQVELMFRKAAFSSDKQTHRRTA